jgi:hypothetical protein
MSDGNGKSIVTTGPSPFGLYANAVSPRTIHGTLLKFAKGDWVAGEDGRAVPEGTEFTVYMSEILAGWVRWEDNKPTEHQMGRIGDGYAPPRRDELGSIDRAAWETDADGKARDPWQFANYVPMKAENTDEMYTFVASSKGALGAIADLCRQYDRHVRKYPDQDPVVRLAAGTYEHKTKSYGRIAFPVFTIIGWTAKADLDAGSPPSDFFDDGIPEFGPSKS